MTALPIPYLSDRLNSGPARPAQKRDFQLGPVARTAIGIAGFTMTFLSLFAVARGVLGLTPELPHLKNIAVIIHVASVLPAVPLGAYVLLARKGTPRHRLLGKIWLALMLVTATSAIFIQTSGGLSFIHIFVPITFHAAWKTIATARKGDIAGHKKHLVVTYMTALMIPGIVAFALPGRLMNVMLLW
ncbi:MAG: DUF2306 domain-containing protein [Alteripontixanthobacter sp.]